MISRVSTSVVNLWHAPFRKKRGGKFTPGKKDHQPIGYEEKEESGLVGGGYFENPIAALTHREWNLI